MLKELTTERSERHNQLIDLHKSIYSDYFILQEKYETQEYELIEYKQKANYWETQFINLKDREKELKEEIQELESKLKKREHQLFGTKSEKHIKKQDNLEGQKSNKNRGQQKGSSGHGKRDYSELPKVEEIVELSENESCCHKCGLPYKEIGTTEDSEILEIINVKAYRRVIRRKRYKPICNCKNHASQIITAKVAERLLPKNKIGISVWALLLINKYGYQNPLYRTLEQLTSYGLSLAMGTVTDGFKKIFPLLIPIYDEIINYSLEAKHWHADETGWRVFEKIETKKNNRWFLWIFQNSETVLYKISPTRSSQLLIDHFGSEHNGGILNVDRYAAYKVISKAGLFILAFCWAHVRRDFLEYSKAYGLQEEWGLSWVKEINNLYHINNNRIQHSEKSRQFRKYQKQLKEALFKMNNDIDEQMKDSAIAPSAKKLLISLKKHWGGLTVFVDSPNIPMDNNIAERGLRSSVTGRKNYYGSGAVWSAKLAAALFSIFKTLKLWNINPHTWLLAYLQECATNNGKYPEKIDSFLPWKMSDKQKELFSQPPKYEYKENFSDTS